MRRLIVILTVLGALAGAGYFVWHSVVQGAQKTPHIQQTTIDRGDLTYSVNATGTLAAAQIANLSFDNPGLVAEVDVQQGQRVAKGDLLARQDATGYALGVAQAEATLKAAQLSLDKLTAPPSDADLAVAQADVKAAQAAYQGLFSAIDPNAVTAARLKVQQAQTAYTDAVQHRRDVGGQVPITSPSYQLALAQEGAASFAVAAAQLQLQLLQRGVDSRLVAAAKARIALAQSELDRIKAGPQPAQIDRTKLAVDQAQAALDQARQQQASAELRAPFAGVVSLMNIKPDALTVSGVPAVVLTDTSQLHVTLNVDEIDVGQVSEGATVTLTLDALPGVTLSGRIDRIALAANPTAGTVVTYPVQVALDPTSAPIKVGMTASASIIVRQVTGVLRVPNLYVRLDQRNNRAFVNLVSADGTLTEIPVTLGLRTEDYSEIVSGLNEGDKVGISLDSNFSILGN